jgi:hypothetical protein
MAMFGMVEDEFAADELFTKADEFEELEAIMNAEFEFLTERAAEDKQTISPRINFEEAGF